MHQIEFQQWLLAIEILAFSKQSGYKLHRMFKYLCCFVLLVALCLTTNPAVGQTEAKPAGTVPAATKVDYSKEAFVAEEDVTKLSFENDGTGTREWLLRIRIQSDA